MSDDKVTQRKWIVARLRECGGDVVSKDYVYKWLDFAEKQTK